MKRTSWALKRFDDRIFSWKYKYISREFGIFHMMWRQIINMQPPYVCTCLSNDAPNQTSLFIHVGLICTWCAAPCYRTRAIQPLDPWPWSAANVFLHVWLRFKVACCAVGFTAVQIGHGTWQSDQVDCVLNTSRKDNATRFFQLQKKRAHVWAQVTGQRLVRTLPILL